MAKNPEELYEQKEFERRHFSRPTLNQLRVAELEREIADLNEQLALVRNTNDHINWLLKRVKKEIKRKDENLGLLDWNSTQADRLSGQIEAFEHVEMLINEIGKPSYFRNKRRENEFN